MNKVEENGENPTHTVFIHHKTHIEHDPGSNQESQVTEVSASPLRIGVSD